MTVSDFDPLTNQDPMEANEIEFLSVNYTELIPFLIAGSKELNSIVDETNAEIINIQDETDNVNSLLETYSQLKESENE
ncbi:MAG: hypothetical protein ABR574_06060 [Cryomorphaceae bacterium]|nr:hypothetical protein [Flavobacteriales bacterium]